MHLKFNRGPAAVSLLLLLGLAGLLLAGCGSSSSSTSIQNASASASSTNATGPSGATGASRFKALRECLQKNGVTLPSRPQGGSGTRPPGAGGIFGGGAQGTPNGVNREKLQEALKKCGGGFGPGRGRFGAGGARLKSPAFQKSLTSFAACMREHGVNLPAPNTSGKGPIFDTKGLNTQSAAFKKADEACRSKLQFARPGATGPAGAPPGGEGATGAAPPEAG
jgi:hypothetical protein